MNQFDCDTPITVDELMSRCMGELDFARNILQSFVESCPEQLEQIRLGIENGDAASLARMVHRLKGTAATVAARPLRQSLEELESLIRNESGSDAKALQQQLDVAVSEFEKVGVFVQSDLL